MTSSVSARRTVSVAITGVARNPMTNGSALRPPREMKRDVENLGSVCDPDTKPKLEGLGTGNLDMCMMCHSTNDQGCVERFCNDTG